MKRNTDRYECTIGGREEVSAFSPSRFSTRGLMDRLVPSGFFD